MNIEPAVLYAFAGVVGTAISFLVRELLKSKDAHIHELRETIRYQRTVSEASLGAARGAVGTLERLA